MLDIYTLKWVDEPLGIFTYDTEKDIFSFTETCKPEFKFRLPRKFDMGKPVDDSMIREWISERVIPRERVNINQILDQLGIKEYDAWEIVRRLQGRTIDNAVWLAKDGETYR